MVNFLRPCGIPQTAYRNIPRELHVPHPDLDPIPAQAGSLIWTKRGTRRLLNNELAKGLGIPKVWMADQYPPGWLVHDTVDVHLLEYLTTDLSDHETPTRITNPSTKERTATNFIPEDSPIPYSWKPPNLSPGRE
jgi:hypothetical protein